MPKVSVLSLADTSSSTKSAILNDFNVASILVLPLNSFTHLSLAFKKSLLSFAGVSFSAMVSNKNGTKASSFATL